MPAVFEPGYTLTQQPWTPDCGVKPAPIMISVVVPACNEEAVIGRCLCAMLADAEPDEVEVVVVCNGCSDRTAAVARTVPGVVVLETPVRSKTNALNLGDARASGFPRLYVDADVCLSTETLRALANELCNGWDIAAPRPFNRTDESCWPVRAFYRVWEMTPYFRAGFVGCGVYGLSKAGRARFGLFPEVISDDGYVRSLFLPHERRALLENQVEVWAPRTFASLVKVKTRSRLGVQQLRHVAPDRFSSDATEKSALRTLRHIVLRPALWTALPVYGLVKFLVARRARRHMENIDSYQWERDDSARVAEHERNDRAPPRR